MTGRLDHDGVARDTESGRSQFASPFGTTALGFSLVEVVLAMLLTSVVMMGISSLLVVGVSTNQGSQDLTLATTLAAEKLEELSTEPYDNVVAGGSLASDVGGYNDGPDVGGDLQVDYSRRWSVTDLGTSKVIRVRAASLLALVGNAKGATLTMKVAQP